MWYMYVVECCDSSFYCGITKSVSDRVVKHNSGKGAKYTRARRPVRLIDSVAVSEDLGTALRAERAFKRLTRKKKEKYLQAGLYSFLEQDSGVYEKN